MDADFDQFYIISMLFVHLYVFTKNNFDNSGWVGPYPQALSPIYTWNFHLLYDPKIFG